MSDHFQGSKHIELQPGDINYPARFRFTVASASTLNDGAIPYGSTLKSIVSSVKSSKDITVSGIISSSMLDGNNAVLYLSHSSTVPDGLYTLTITAKFSISGSTLILTKEFDFRRLYLRNE